MGQVKAKPAAENEALDRDRIALVFNGMRLADDVAVAACPIGTSSIINAYMTPEVRAAGRGGRWVGQVVGGKWWMAWQVVDGWRAVGGVAGRGGWQVVGGVASGGWRGRWWWVAGLVPLPSAVVPSICC